MSLQNILEPNNNDLYCHDLTISGSVIIHGGGTIENINISGTLTMENTSTLDLVSGSQIAGTANFNNTSLVNFSSGSLIEGIAKIGNGGTVTFNGGTDLTISSTANFNNNGIATFSNGSRADFQAGCDVRFPEYDISVSPQWSDLTNDFPVIPPTQIINFRKIGKQITAHIAGFKYIGIGLPGFFYIPYSGVPTEILPDRQYTLACTVINDDVSSSGYIFCNNADERFEIRLSGVNGDDNFSGTNTLEQGLNYTFNTSGYVLSFTYATA